MDRPRPKIPLDHWLVVALSTITGLLVATGLMVIDEIITLLRYCPGCRYQVPFLGPLDPYDAEGFAWALILVGFFLLIVVGLIFPRRRGFSQEK